MGAALSSRQNNLLVFRHRLTADILMSTNRTYYVIWTLFTLWNVKYIKKYFYFCDASAYSRHGQFFSYKVHIRRFDVRAVSQVARPVCKSRTVPGSQRIEEPQSAALLTNIRSGYNGFFFCDLSAAFAFCICVKSSVFVDHIDIILDNNTNNFFYSVFLRNQMVLESCVQKPLSIKRNHDIYLITYLFYLNVYLNYNTFIFMRFIYF